MMFSARTAISPTLLLCFSSIALGQFAEPQNREISMVWGNRVDFNIAVGEDGSFYFVICPDIRAVININCTVHIIRPSGPHEVHQFRYESLDDRKTNAIDFAFDLIGNMLYGWIYQSDERHDSERTHLAGIAVDLTTNSVSKFALPSNLENSRENGNGEYRMVVNSDGVQLIVANSPACGNYEQCDFTFNKRGELLEGPVPHQFQNTAMIDFPKMPGSEDKGVMVVHLPGNQATYYDGNGNPTIVHTFDEVPELFSNNHDFYLLCAFGELGNELDCAQYDWKTNTTSVMRLNASACGEKDIVVESVVSLNKSKILLASSKCDGGETEDIACSEIFQILSFDSDGELPENTPIFKDYGGFGGSSSVVSMTLAEVRDQLCIYTIRRYFGPSNDDPRAEYTKVHIECLPLSDSRLH
ncbi:hypothetical protein QAD02_004895 [Eretmocerus hayati]|uniref:Uncharacterized protein n=1 Tax=Eretmocerus hayati TaxID=131215 RepID=A0ACC2NRY3_9HYME|nr:hypothetical protein QAD02_004895 [Eretmocerus hayati]